MTRDEVLQKHKQFLFNCVTTYYKDPVVIDHAKGQYICDVDGRQYLDFLGGIVTTTSLLKFITAYLDHERGPT